MKQEEQKKDGESLEDWQRKGNEREREANNPFQG